MISKTQRMKINFQLFVDSVRLLTKCLNNRAHRWKLVKKGERMKLADLVGLKEEVVYRLSGKEMTSVNIEYRSLMSCRWASNE